MEVTDTVYFFSNSTFRQHVETKLQVEIAFPP